jgi:site-specific recombinase XerD
MPRLPAVPAYRRHKQSGQAVVTLPDGLGRRRDVLLGRYGTPESRRAYARVLAEWEAAGRRLSRPVAASDLTVNELVLAYWKHARDYYGWAQNPKRGDKASLRSALRVIRKLYGDAPARDFGPLCLKACRARMIHKGWARSYINAEVDRLRRMFRWSAEEELLPGSVYDNLAKVTSLRKGKSGARESEPVRPVADEVVDATLALLSPMLRAMAEVQRLTGARPGEICRLRVMDLERSQPVWVYRPGSDRGPEGEHKTSGHGHERAVLIGPRAQEILRPWLETDPAAYVFSPRRSETLRNAARRQTRKTPMTPSQAARRPKSKPERPRGERYSVAAYRLAVYRACDRAFAPPPPLAKRDDETWREWRARLSNEDRAELRRWRKAHRWHPHRLRHVAATVLRKEYGIEVAKIILGHATLTAAQVYAERDLAKAMGIIGRIG